MRSSCVAAGAVLVLTESAVVGVVVGEDGRPSSARESSARTSRPAQRRSVAVGWTPAEVDVDGAGDADADADDPCTGIATSSASERTGATRGSGPWGPCRRAGSSRRVRRAPRAARSIAAARIVSRSIAIPIATPADERRRTGPPKRPGPGAGDCAARSCSSTMPRCCRSTTTLAIGRPRQPGHVHELGPRHEPRSRTAWNTAHSFARLRSTSADRRVRSARVIGRDDGDVRIEVQKSRSFALHQSLVYTSKEWY